MNDTPDTRRFPTRNSIPAQTLTMSPDTQTVVMLDPNGRAFAVLTHTNRNDRADGWEAYVLHDLHEDLAAAGVTYEVAIALAFQDRPQYLNNELGGTVRPVFAEVVYSNQHRTTFFGEWVW